MNVYNYKKLSEGLSQLNKEELVERLTRLERAIEYGCEGDQAIDYQNIVYDLEVHQVELEMQNRELRSSQYELESIKEQFALLYEYAPVGYCTVDIAGTICQIRACK